MRGVRTGTACAAALALLAGEAFGCTAASTIQQAQNNYGLQSYDTARAVASEELDREGIEKDRRSQFDDANGESTTATPLESAVGTLFLEKFRGQYGVYDETKDGVMTIESWRTLLSDPSADHGLATVREHVLMHAREFASATAVPLASPVEPPAPPIASPAVAATKDPASETVPKPAALEATGLPADAPAVAPAPPLPAAPLAPSDVEGPVAPPIDHAG